MDFKKMRELAGLPPATQKAVLVESLERFGITEPKYDNTGGKLFALYVGLRGSGKLTIQFTGDKVDCQSQWHDDLKRDYKRGEAVARIVPVYNGEAPEVIAEAVEAVEGLEELTEEVDHSDVDPVAPQESGPVPKVPSDVTSGISKRVTELKAAIALSDEKGYNDGSVKQNAIDALEQIAADLKKPDGLTVANIFYHSLMGPILELIPPVVIKFLHKHKPATVKEAAEANPFSGAPLAPQQALAPQAPQAAATGTLSPEFVTRVTEFAQYLEGAFKAEFEQGGNGGSFHLFVEDKHGEHFANLYFAAVAAIEALVEEAPNTEPYQESLAPSSAKQYKVTNLDKPALGGKVTPENDVFTLIHFGTETETESSAIKNQLAQSGVAEVQLMGTRFRIEAVDVGVV